MSIFGLKAIAVRYNRYVHFNNDAFCIDTVLNMHDCMSCHKNHIETAAAC